MEKTVHSFWPLFARGIVAALILALLAVAASCTGDDDVDPEELFSKAVPAMRALESFSFTYDVERPEGAKPVQGTDVAAIDGSVNAEGSMQARIDILQSGIPLQVNFVAAGDTHYVENPLTGKWQSVAASASPVGKLNLGAGAITILEKIQEPTYEGTEEIDGAETHMVKGTVTSADIEAIAQAVSVEREFPVQVWVGAEDYLVRRISLEGAATPKEDEKTVRTIELMKFNEPVDIKPPQ